MGEMSKNAIDFEAEKPIEQIRMDIESIERVSVDGMITKIVPIEMYAYLLTYSRDDFAQEKQSDDPKNPSRDIATMVEYLENASEFIVKAQAEGLNNGEENAYTKYFFQSRQLYQELSSKTKEFIRVFEERNDTRQLYEEISKLCKDIYSLVENVRVIYSGLIKQWESSTGQKWDKKSLVVPFPYEEGKAEYRSQYLIDN